MCAVCVLENVFAAHVFSVGKRNHERGEEVVRLSGRGSHLLAYPPLPPPPPAPSCASPSSPPPGPPLGLVLRTPTTPDSSCGLPRNEGDASVALSQASRRLQQEFSNRGRGVSMRDSTHPSFYPSTSLQPRAEELLRSWLMAHLAVGGRIRSRTLTNYFRNGYCGLFSINYFRKKLATCLRSRARKSCVPGFTPTVGHEGRFG